MKQIIQKLKKILNNIFFKISICVIATVYIALIIVFKKWYLLFLTLICVLIFLIVFYKLYFNINIINITKIKNYFLFKKQASQFKNEDELYSKIININTFDGSGGGTHPSVLYFENGFNGYKFWMVYTPYDNNNISLENPCIVVSNDGINFFKPEGLKEPLLDIVNERNPKKYYNDPNLIFTDKLEIWYRFTIEYGYERLENYVYRITSLDGIKWSEPELILSDKDNDFRFMSLSLVYQGDKYRMYYVNKKFATCFVESKDLKKWTKEKAINVEGFNSDYWHGEIKLENNVYNFLFNDKKYNLYYCLSKDGYNFTRLIKLNILCKTKDYFYSKCVRYKACIVSDNKYLYIYVPFRFDKVKLFRINNSTHKKWYWTVTKIKKENIEKIKSSIY